MQRLNEINPNIYNLYPEMEDVIGETINPTVTPAMEKPTSNYSSREENLQKIAHQHQSEPEDIAVKTVNVRLVLDIELKIKVIGVI